MPLVGGKAFRLAVLKQHGLNVPPGLVVTTAFFEAQLEHSRLTPLWAGSPEIAVTTEALNWLANTLKTKPLKKKLAEALNQHVELLFGNEVDSFAVRSSVIDEDQRDHTFAGIHLTELGVPRSVLPIAITRCWASALSEPAIEYRQDHGMSIQSIRVAVLIQSMLNPASSGIGFSVDPLSGAGNELIIEATWGPGEPLVRGKIQPYFYKLANQPPDYPLIEQQAGSVPPPVDEVEQTQNDPLSAKELTELATQLEQIHALMGEAQDVEWVRQDDTFFILQTRPVAIPAKSAPMLDWEWTRGSHPEFLPELPSPLCGSLLERAQNRAITFFREMGLDVEELGPYVKLILGRPYLNLTFLKRMIMQVGILPGNLLYTIGHTEPGAAGGTLSIDWEIAWKARRAYWLALKKMLNSSRALKRFQATVDEAVGGLHSVKPDAPLATLLKQLRQHDQIYSDLLDVNLRLATGISAVTVIGSALIAPLTPTPVTFISTLALRDVKTTNGELNRALLKLAYQAGNIEQVQKYLAGAPDDFHDYDENPLVPDEFRHSFEKLLATFGHRATYETDVAWPRHRDDPASLLRVVRQYVQNQTLSSVGDPTAASPALPDSAAVNWSDLTGQARGLARLIPWRRWLALPFVVLLRRLLSMREMLHTARATVMAACRRWDLTLGQKWVDEGWLAHPEDIFWLTMEEIERALIVGSDVGVTLSSIVQARKETYQTYADTVMPFNLHESQISRIRLGIGLSSEPPSEVMMGLPISPGQARGRALVLNAPDEFEKSGEDIILIMSSTDPAWLPLLRLASGLIVEMGGLLSHGSVIAREYGLPAVANIPNATKRFHTGDSVFVDGSTGIVQLLEPAQAALSQKQKAG